MARKQYELQPIRCARHDFRCQIHECTNGRGKLAAAGRGGILAVSCLVDAHLFEDGTRTGVVNGELCKMRVQVATNLFFSFGDKAQTDLVAGKSGERANRERCSVPNGIQYAFATAEFLDSIGTPCKMVRLFLCRLDHGCLGRGATSSEGLSGVKRLRCHLARMVDSHEGCYMLAIGWGANRIGQIAGRIGALAVVGAGDRAECLVESVNKAVQRGDVPIQPGLGGGSRGVCGWGRHEHIIRG